MTNKAYLISAAGEYVVGYAKAESSSVAKSIALKKGMVDGYDYIHLKAFRCSALDAYDFDLY